MPDCHATQIVSVCPWNDLATQLVKVCDNPLWNKNATVCERLPSGWASRPQQETVKLRLYRTKERCQKNLSPTAHCHSTETHSERPVKSLALSMAKPTSPSSNSQGSVSSSSVYMKGAIHHFLTCSLSPTPNHCPAYKWKQTCFILQSKAKVAL